MEFKTPQNGETVLLEISASPNSCSPLSGFSYSSNDSLRKRSVQRHTGIYLNDDSILNVPRIIDGCTLRSEDISCVETAVSIGFALKHKKSFSADAMPFIPSHSRSHLHDSSPEFFAEKSMAMNDYLDCKDHIPVAELPRAPLHHSHSFHTFPRRHYSQPQSFSDESHAIANTQSSQGETNGGLHQPLYDPYVTPPSSMATSNHTSQQPQINPYTQESSSSGSASYYQNSSFAQPIQYHLYTSLAPHREALLPYQRAAHDFFIPDNIREDLQRKSATTLQTLPSMYFLYPAEMI